MKRATQLKLRLPTYGCISPLGCALWAGFLWLLLLHTFIFMTECV